MLKKDLKPFLNLVYSYLYYQKDQWLETNTIDRAHYENFQATDDQKTHAVLLPSSDPVYDIVENKSTWADKVHFWKTGTRSFRMGRDPVLTSSVILKTVPKELVNSIYRPQWTLSLIRYPYRLQIIVDPLASGSTIGVTQQSAGFCLTHYIQNRSAAKIHVATQTPDWAKTDTENLLEVIQHRELWLQPVVGWEYKKENKWIQLFDLYMLTVTDNRTSLRRGFSRESLTDNSDNFSKGLSHKFYLIKDSSTANMPVLNMPVHLGDTFVYTDRIYGAEWADKFGMNYDQPYFCLYDQTQTGNPLWERGYKTYNYVSPSKYDYADLIPLHAYASSLCEYPFKHVV